MDNSNNQNQPQNQNTSLTKPNFNDPNDDKEYQAILDQYADVLSKSSTDEKISDEPQKDAPKQELPLKDLSITEEPAPISIDTPIADTPKEEPILDSKKDLPSISAQPIAEPQPISTSSPSPEETLIHPSLNNNIDEDDEFKKTTPVEDLISKAKDITSSPRPNLDDQGPLEDPISAPKVNSFKIAFIFSLLLFLGVGAAFVFALFKSPSSNQVDNSSSTQKNITTPTSVPKLTGVCKFDDKEYSVGESFASADGCNTCTCEKENVISCTEKACLATSSAVTKPATSSSEKVATSSTKSAVKKITPTPKK